MAIELHGPDDPVYIWRNPDKKGTGLIYAVLNPATEDKDGPEAALRFGKTVKDVVDATFGGDNHGGATGWVLEKRKSATVVLRDGKFTHCIEIKPCTTNGHLRVGVIYFDGDTAGLTGKIAEALSSVYPNAWQIEGAIFNTTREENSCEVSVCYDLL